MAPYEDFEDYIFLVNRNCKDFVFDFDYSSDNGESERIIQSRGP